MIDVAPISVTIKIRIKFCFENIFCFSLNKPINSANETNTRNTNGT